MITERRVPELIPVLGSQPAGNVSHKPGGRAIPSHPIVLNNALVLTCKTFSTVYLLFLDDLLFIYLLI